MRIITSIFYRLRWVKSVLVSRLHRLCGCVKSRLYGGTVNWPRSVMAAVPVRADGVGHVSIGEGVGLGYRPAPRIGSGEILIQARARGSRISIGARTLISNNLSIIAMKSVEIGGRCQIGDLVSIFDCDFHEIEPTARLGSHGSIEPVVIGTNVWLGSRVMILKGVSIGENTVVAAGSVVTKSLPANVVAAGIPAKVIREIKLPSKTEN